MYSWILGLLLCSTPASEWILVERVVAVVADEPVLASELDRRVEIASVPLAKLPDAAERQRRNASLRSELLQTIIDERLIDQAAARLGIAIEESQLDAAVTEIKSANRLDDASFARALAETGSTLPEYREDLRRQLLRFKLLMTLPNGSAATSDAAVAAAHAAEKANNPNLGDLAAESSRLRTVLFERAISDWLATARRVTHVELRP